MNPRDKFPRIDDEVAFYFENIQSVRGRLVGLPGTDDDTWIVHTDNGTIWTIRMFACMEVLSRKVTNDPAQGNGRA